MWRYRTAYSSTNSSGNLKLGVVGVGMQRPVTPLSSQLQFCREDWEAPVQQTQQLKVIATA